MRALGGPALLLVAACSSKAASTSKEVTGTLTLDGKPLAITRCVTGRAVTTFIELVTPSGKLRFEDAQLFWSEDVSAVSRGEPLDCQKLDRSWGGGQRLDGTAYFRGTLDFRCTGRVGAVVGKITADCGNITAAERASLDQGRANKLAEQAAAAADAGTPEPAGDAGSPEPAPGSAAPASATEP